jgi:hypothetical protein
MIPAITGRSHSITGRSVAEGVQRSSIPETVLFYDENSTLLRRITAVKHGAARVVSQHLIVAGRCGPVTAVLWRGEHVGPLRTSAYGS